MGLTNQFPTDASALKRLIDGQIGQVSAITEVADRPRHTDKLPVLASRHKDVGVGKHLRNGREVVYGTAFGQRGPH